MAKRRLLPEAAYDFWTHDSRDGEESFAFDTLAEAQENARLLRNKLEPWRRCVITVRWAVNEKKVLRLLSAPPKRSEAKR